MKEMELKYGCNPNQKPSRVYMELYKMIGNAVPPLFAKCCAKAVNDIYKAYVD